MIDRKAQRMTDGTTYIYTKELQFITTFCAFKLIEHTTQITANDLREYMMYLERTGHNAGVRHACYRALKTFLFWREDEIEPEDWKNPIRKGKPP